MSDHRRNLRQIRVNLRHFASVFANLRQAFAMVAPNLAILRPFASLIVTPATLRDHQLSVFVGIFSDDWGKKGNRRQAGGRA
jgi:hypothetical protein